MKKLFLIIGFILCLSSCSVVKAKYITKETNTEHNADIYTIRIQEDESVPTERKLTVIYHGNTHIWSSSEDIYPLGFLNTESAIKGEWKSGAKVSGIKNKNGVVTSITVDGITYKLK